MKDLMAPMAFAITLSIGLAMPPAYAAPGLAGVHGGSGGHGLGFHHRVGFHHRFLPPRHLFHQSHFDFGAGFASRPSILNGGDYSDSFDDDYGPYPEDDIENLHFRAQEPFGPGDIGRRPVRPAEDEPYTSGRMDPRLGFAPGR